MRLLGRVAQRLAPPGLEAGDRVELEEARDGRRLHDAAMAGEPLDDAAQRAGAEQHPAEPGGHGLRDLLEARMEVLGNLEDLPFLQLHLLRDALEAEARIFSSATRIVSS